MEEFKLNELIRLLCRREVRYSDEQIGRAWQDARTRGELARRMWRRRFIRRSAAACAAAAVVAVVALIFSGTNPEISDIEYYALNLAPAAETDYTGNTRLRVQAGEEVEVGSTEANFDYSTGGSIVSDADTLSREAYKTPGQYNQLIVPCGRHARLRLNDGTVIQVNSRTRIVYPADFSTGEREIFLEGEAYFDVARDESRPLTVRTARCAVRVLGTAFNVCAYPAAAADEVVLARGRVRVEAETARRDLVPGQMAAADGRGVTEPRSVDIDRYLCWMDNYLVCDNKPVSEILDRLHYIYGVDFETACELDNMKISGKLDLTESLEDVLEILSYSIPLEFEHNNNTVNVTRRNV